jgi:hypothetical protein
MARGWESKAVESQQELAAERHRQVGPPVDRQSAERKAERAMLALSLARAEADLKVASAPAHRAMLERAIADLNDRLATLDGAPGA